MLKSAKKKPVSRKVAKYAKKTLSALVYKHKAPCTPCGGDLLYVLCYFAVQKDLIFFSDWAPGFVVKVFSVVNAFAQYFHEYLCH